MDGTIKLLIASFIYVKLVVNTVHGCKPPCLCVMPKKSILFSMRPCGSQS